MKIIFIRHGEPNYEIDSLTEKGWREAELSAWPCERYGFFYTEKCRPRSRNSSMAAGI